MADIQFEEEPQYQRAVLIAKKSFLIRFVLSTGIVSSEQAANYVLLTVAVCAIVLAIAWPFWVGSPHVQIQMNTVRKLAPPSAGPNLGL